MLAVRRRVILSMTACVLGVAALFACGDDELCDTQCAGGRLQQICCKAGETCPDIPPFCDLGGGACTLGDCTPGSAEAGSDAAHDGGVGCGTSTCEAGEACIVTQTSGGACLQPDDDGGCPNGQAPSGGCCNSSSKSFECKALPATCAAGLTCTCASPPLCACPKCEVLSASTLQCTCLVP